MEDAARRRPVVYDKGGDAHYDFTSAFIKAIRGSDPDAALYYLASMLEGGEDPRFIARRLIVHASEDIGMADSQALVVAAAAAHAVEHVGLPEARLNLAHATIYLARAPKSNAVINALGAASQDVREHGALQPPKALRDAHYPGRQEARPRSGLRLSAERPRRLRRRLPAGRAQGTNVLRARGRLVRLNTYEWGDESAPLVVCLHGVTGHGLRFRKLAEERLADRFHVVAADLRGHGHSTWERAVGHRHPRRRSRSRPSTSPRTGSATASAAGSMASSPPVRPELVRRAVLLDPAIFIPPYWADDLAAEARAGGVLRLGGGGASRRASFGAALRTRRATSSRRRSPSTVVERPDGRIGYRYSGNSVGEAYMQLAAPPPPFDALRIPTLVVVGSLSKIVGAGEIELYKQALG